MKNLNILKKVLLLCSFFYFLNANAQAPEKMSYQAVIRNAANALVANQAVGMKISILQGSASGTAVYTETQTPTSNVNGLVSVEIGSGTVVTGTFASINWANGPYFIKTETDPTGGTSYTITGTSQLLSSPYALYAKNGTPTGGTAGQVLTTNGTTASWTTPSAGTTLPSQTGNAGNVLTTNGAGTLSWGSSSGAKLELEAYVTTAQTFTTVSSLSSQPTPPVVAFNAPTTSPTLGTYNASTNTYTVGTTGLYYIEVYISGSQTWPQQTQLVPTIQIGTADDDADDIYGISSYYLVTARADRKSRAWVHGIRYLTAGTTLKVRALNNSNVISISPNPDGSSRWTIVKL